MFLRKTTLEQFADEYGVRSLRLYPWRDVVTPPFGSMLTRIEPGKRTSRHNHHEGETFFIVSGRGRSRIGDEFADVSAGDLLYAPPFSNHTLENTSADEPLVSLAVWWEDMALARAAADSPALAPAATRRLLVTATPPTVNGNLHLGHLSGPYLAADVFVRAQRMTGTEVAYLSGADDHQSYVVRKGGQQGLAPRAVCERYTAEIERSLELAAIDMDLFARPSTSPHHRRFVQELFTKLHDAGDIHARQAPSLWCVSCDRYLFEAHVGGSCPHCGSGSDGCACEACGRPNDCVDLRDPKCKRCGASPEVREVERLYFRLGRYEAALRDYWTRARMPPHLIAICEHMLQGGLPDVAVSHVTDWGIPVPVPGFAGQCVYVWFEMAPGYLAATQEMLDARGGGASWRDLWCSDGAEVVQFFGIDNGWFHAVLFPAVWAAYDPAIRPPSTFVVNEFYRLEGDKFSTSRNHAIWVSDFLATESADAARFYLTLDRPEHRETSFSLDEYRRTVHAELTLGWQAWLRGLGRKAVAEFDGKAPVTGAYSSEHRAFFALVHELIARCGACYSSASFSSVGAVRCARELARAACEFGSAQDFLRGVAARRDERRTAVALELMAANALAMLASPLLPGFAARLRRALGWQTDEPRWNAQPEFLPGGQDVRALAEVSFGFGGAGRE
jgi:methionyl-tRNA synthetase